MNITPELIESIGKLVIGTIAAVGGIVSTVAGFYTWKTRYELDKLYSKTYRPNPDGTPGPMRKHPEAMVKLFHRKAQKMMTVNEPNAEDKTADEKSPQ